MDHQHEVIQHQHQHPHHLTHEPEELPALSNLDLNSLTEHTRALAGQYGAEGQAHGHGGLQAFHSAHHSPYGSLATSPFPPRPVNPARTFSSATAVPGSPSSSPTDPDSATDAVHALLHEEGRDADAERSFEEAYYASPSSPYAPSSYHPRNPGDFPPEIIALIVHHLFYEYLPYPSAFPNPDPYLELLPADTSSFFMKPARLAPTLDAQAKEVLAACALVDKMWNAEATRALWRRVSFGFPRAFESVLRTIEEYSGGRRVRRPLGSDLRTGSGDQPGGLSLGLDLTPKHLEQGFGAVELGKGWMGEKGSYVERWRREGSEGFAVENVLQEPVDIEPSRPLSSIIPSPADHADSTFPLALPRLNPRDSPLLFTRSISFARFRTAGMKRSIRSGKEERFVTPERLLTLLRGTRYPKKKLVFPVEKEEEEEGYGGKGFSGYGTESEAETETDTESETPGGGFGGGNIFGGWGRNSRKKMAGQLCQVGFSEYMDSAITFPILQEVLFRGGYLAEYEEPDEPAFPLPSANDFASSSGSSVGGSTPYFNSSSLNLPSHSSNYNGEPKPFHYRHLQTSTSRSPSVERRRSSSVSTRVVELAGSEGTASAPHSGSGGQGSGSRTPVEEQTTPEQEYPDSFGPRDIAVEDAEMGDGARTPIGRRPSYRRRRLSGLAFAPAHSAEPASPQSLPLKDAAIEATPQQGQHQFSREPQQHLMQSHEDGEYYSSGDSDLSSVVGREEDGERERGRERFSRNASRLPSDFSTHLENALGRGRSRYPSRAGLYNGLGIGGGPAGASGYQTRSSSLPAPFNGHSQPPSPFQPPALRDASSAAVSPLAAPPTYVSGPVGAAPRASRTREHSMSSRASERSSSVPASVRWDREPVPKRTVQVLEGSLGMQPVRALDLCGCVSRVFVAALDEFVETYKLGPPPLRGEEQQEQQDMMEDDDEDDDFAGRRTPSIGSVRMGLAEERVLNRTFFPHLRRLGLASSLLPSHLLTAFVLSFPYLTHLDLASTLTSPLLLKGLALAGQNGIGGRPMRLKALSLSRCRLITGPALLGLFCGDCPPMTTMAGISDDENESWGAGEVVSDLTDLNLFGDGTYPCPLEGPELRLVLTVSPAFRSGQLRTVDLASAPMTDEFLLEHFPPQPHLIELGLAHCRAITMQAVSTFLCTKAPAVEVLDLSHSCPSNVGQGISSRRRTFIGQPTISIMELHAVLLGQCASVESSSSNPDEAQLLLALRQTNLRVVELDEKSLELVQGGAGDWKPISGKGRRGWYVDTATSSRIPPYDPSHPPYPRPRQLAHLPRDHPQRQALLKLSSSSGLATFEVGWHARKMEVLKGEGFFGARQGLFAFHSYA
ncbi:hypothetical protein JCM11251_003961 [Rhodosporidiobolus azoricus]